MSIESQGYQPEQELVEGERQEAESLTAEQRQSLPIVEMTQEDHLTLDTQGKDVRVSDVLRHKGIAPGSGFVRFRTPEGEEIVVTTDAENYGGLVG